MNKTLSLATDEHRLTPILPQNILFPPKSKSVSIGVHRWLISLCFGFGLCFSIASAETVYTTVQLPFTLDNLGHSPRVMAMGSAYAAGESDASCLFWNPAGLDGLPQAEISVDHQEWLDNVTQETLLGAFPVSKVGTFAMAVNYLNFGDLQGYGPTGDPTTTLQPFRGNLSIGWGGTVAHQFSLGVAARGLYESLANGQESFSSAFSVGAIWRVLPFFRLGASYSLSTAATSPSLGVMTLGESWAVPLFNGAPALILLDFFLPSNGVYRIEAGIEQPILTDFFARAGFRQDLRDNQIQGFRGFTCGLGVKFQAIEVDYSYIPDGDLGYSQNFGLTFHFPEDSPIKKPVSNTPPTQEQPVNFKPPEQLTAADKVVKVEVQFALPAPRSLGEGGTQPAPTPISPQLQAALDQAGQKVQKNPKDVAAWVALGNLYWQTGQPEFAVQSFEEALYLDPSNQQIRSWLDQYRRLNPKTP